MIRLSPFQIRLLDAVNASWNESDRFDKIAFYKAFDPAADEFRASMEACREMCRCDPPLLRDLQTKGDLIESVTPCYQGIAYKELVRLERKERWKERAYGFAVAVITEVLIHLILSLMK